MKLSLLPKGYHPDLFELGSTEIRIGTQAKMKTIVFAIAALSLPFLGRFEETKVLQGGRIVFEHASYGQTDTAGLMIVAALVLFCAAVKESRRTEGGQISRFVRFAPALFALPALWQDWSVSRFGDLGISTEIKSGLGGPMTYLLLLAAAALFIAADAY